MKIFKFWSLEKDKPFIETLKTNVPISCWGGSNNSIEDSQLEARKKIALIVQKLNGRQQKEDDYVVEIREEIFEEIDKKNIITRNRYGALVLNCEELIFIDVDQAKKSFFDMFNIFKSKDEKQQMLEQIISMAKKWSGLNFRIYETKNGFRIIVANTLLKVSDEKVKKLFEDFNCDKLYSSLCFRQECYRARITPKPKYIKQRQKRFFFPITSQEEKEKQEQWLEKYNEKSKKFSTCHLIKEIGPRVKLNPIIEIHDRYTRTRERLPLG